MRSANEICDEMERLTGDVIAWRDRAVAAEQERDRFERELVLIIGAGGKAAQRADRAEAALAAVRETVEAWPDGNVRASEYTAARIQCKRAVLAALAAVEQPEPTEAPGHYDGDGCTFPTPGHSATTESWDQ